MKKLLIVLIIFISASSVMAKNFYVDLLGSYTDTTDAEWQIGGGYSLVYDTGSNINLLYRGIFSFRNTTEGLTTECKYSHMMHVVGVEYIPHIPFLYNYRLIVKATILGGISETGVSVSTIGSSSSSEISDMGFSFAAYAGLQFIWTQYMSPFVEFGWHQSFYSKELTDSKIYGIQANIGIRVSIFGNKSIDEGYE